MTEKPVTEARFYSELGANTHLAREAAGKRQSDVALHLDLTFPAGAK